MWLLYSAPVHPQCEINILIFIDNVIKINISGKLISGDENIILTIMTVTV